MTNRTITLEAGSSKAVIGLTGAALIGLQLGERELIPKANLRTETFFGSLLAPWPNRIRAAKYRFQGADHTLEPVDGLGNALHGLVFDQDAQVVEQSTSRLVLKVAVPCTNGYPFQIEILVTFELSPFELQVEILAKNVGNTPAPIGLGHHPYFVVERETTVEIRARHAAIHNAQKIPVREVATGEIGFETGFPRLVADLELDTQFSGLDEIAARLGYGEDKFDLWVSGGDFLMVYTPRDFPWESGAAPAIAIEPQSCSVNAFNSGQGLATLAPGGKVTLAWGIRKVG